MLLLSSVALQSHFLEREKLIYQRLGRDHSGIVRYFGALENAIILQFASQTSIRQYLARQTKQVPLSYKPRWVEQIFDAIQFVHSKSLLHGDISCNNVFLDESLNVKLGDFGGSAIDNLPPLVCYETSHELPDEEDISTRTELFALGSTVYEIMTGSKPYKDLTDREVYTAFSEGRFPDLDPLSAFRDMIMKCWMQNYVTVEEVLQDVRLEVATIQESRMSRLHAILASHSTIVFPFFLTVVSLIPLIYRAKRWTSL